MKTLNGYLAIKPSTKTGGLELADDMSNEGEVIHTLDTYTVHGVDKSVPIKVGDRVLYESGQYLSHEDLVYIKTNNIIAIL